MQLTIADTGSWKTPETAVKSQRGRGIRLMRALMQDVAIHPDTAGTTVHLSARIA
ncbi:MAG: ATP-binding protein [Mycobacterium sp.]|uniref:ATP-binding protein n=1 Tax=Mycobacterium sp. TaxID=1785 RepID=UPI003F98D2C5